MESASTSAQKRSKNKYQSLLVHHFTDHRRLIQIYGDSTVVAYGCRRILLYTQEEIHLQRGKRSVLRILGMGLCCTCFSAGAVTVEGHIHGVLFEDEETAKLGVPRKGGQE